MFHSQILVCKSMPNLQQAQQEIYVVSKPLIPWSSSLDLLVQKWSAICHQTLYRSVSERFWKHVTVTALKGEMEGKVAGKNSKLVSGSAKRDPGSSGKRLGANFAVYDGAQSR